MKRMKIRRIAAAAAGSAMLFQTAAALPVHGADSYILHDDFESGVSGWKGRGASSVKTDTTCPYEGNSALFVYGRTDAWNGAEKDISDICEAGKTYSVSVCTRYESGPKSMKFMLTLTYTGEDGKAAYDHIAEATTIAGFYVQLSDASYTLPSGATDPVLFIETESGNTSFYIDEVICAEAGTAIEGPQPVSFTLGDVNYDGTVNASDYTYAKRFAEGTVPSKAMKSAADVDQSGTVDADDVKWYQRFLAGQETEYPTPVKPPVEPYNYPTDALQYHACPQEYLRPSSPAGRIIEEKYQGTTGTNTLYVYLPYNYDENQKYNIFYLLHGGGENEKTLFFQDDTMMQYIFDGMIANGELEPMIIVTPTWNQTGADKFYTEFRDKVVPFVEGKYPTYAETTDQAGLQASRYHRAYGGFSMGSVSTWGVLTHCLDIVAYYMPLSGDYRIDGLSSGYDKAKCIADAIDASGLDTDEYFIFCGTGSEDIAYPNMTPQIEEMKKMPQFVYSSDLSKGNFYYLVRPGGIHWWENVRNYIYDILPFFFHEKQEM